MRVEDHDSCHGTSSLEHQVVSYVNISSKDSLFDDEFSKILAIYLPLFVGSYILGIIIGVINGDIIRGITTGTTIAAILVLVVSLILFFTEDVR